MTAKVYRTAMGKMVDIGAIQLKNEKVRAVGNMGVNARGDVVDADNRPIASRNSQVQKQYRKQTNVSNQEVFSSRDHKSAVDIPPPPEDFEDSVDRNSIETSGLLSAISKAKQQR